MLIIFALLAVPAAILFVFIRRAEANEYVVESDARTKRLADAIRSKQRAQMMTIGVAIVALLLLLFTYRPAEVPPPPAPAERKTKRPPKDTVKFNPKTMEGTGPLEN